MFLESVVCLRRPDHSSRGLLPYGCVSVCLSNCARPRNLKNEAVEPLIGLLGRRKRNDTYNLIVII